MNCLDCQDWLQRTLDGEHLPVQEAMEQHWMECATCREQHGAALSLLEGLPLLSKPRPAPGFPHALAMKVNRDRQHRQGKMRRRVYVTMALAASVLLLLVFGYYWMPGSAKNDHQPADTVVHHQPELKSAPVPKAPEDPVHVKEPRNALQSLTERWADATREHAKVVLVATNLDTVENLPAMQVLPPLDPGVREAGQEMTDGMRAVTRNTQRAFLFFARELPMPESETPRN